MSENYEQRPRRNASYNQANGINANGNRASRISENARYAQNSDSSGRYASPAGSSQSSRSRRSVQSNPYSRTSFTEDYSQYDRSNYSSRQNAGSRSASSQRTSSRSAGTRSAGSRATNSSNSRNNSANQRRESQDMDYTSTQYAAKAAREKRRKSKIPIVVGALVVILLVAGIGIFRYVSSISDNLHQGVTEEVRESLVETEYSKEPFYMLLMGTDESAERVEEGTYGVFRSDSMMLVRIDCQNKKATVVSLERDTLIDMGEYGYQKLNAATAFGGIPYAVEVVNELCGVEISHFATINFDGFAAMVDAVGGVEVDVPIEIDDDDAGGYLAAGKQTLNGQQALILCRSRNAYNDYGSGDYYRAANQRMVLSALADKILDADIGTIANTVTTLSQYVTTDFELTDIIGIAQAMRGIDMTSDIYTAMQPTYSVYEDGMWFDRTYEDEWATMMERVREGLSPTEDDVVDATGTVMASSGSGTSIGGSSANVYTNSKSGTVTVWNGNGGSGIASSGGLAIGNMGYDVETGNADSYDYEDTLIIFNDASLRHDALAIAQQLGCGKLYLNNGEYSFSSDFLVILGSDYS
jgi:polyisoprenyl-teichoic acid--peptidoglycan teichoic acid transferase